MADDVSDGDVESPVHADLSDGDADSPPHAPRVQETFDFFLSAISSNRMLELHMDRISGLVRPGQGDVSNYSEIMNHIIAMKRIRQGAMRDTQNEFSSFLGDRGNESYFSNNVDVARETAEQVYASWASSKGIQLESDQSSHNEELSDEESLPGSTGQDHSGSDQSSHNEEMNDEESLPGSTGLNPSCLPPNNEDQNESPHKPSRLFLGAHSRGDEASVDSIASTPSPVPPRKRQRLSRDDASRESSDGDDDQEALERDGANSHPIESGSTTRQPILHPPEVAEDPADDEPGATNGDKALTRSGREKGFQSNAEESDDDELHDPDRETKSKQVSNETKTFEPLRKVVRSPFKQQDEEEVEVDAERRERERSTQAKDDSLERERDERSPLARKRPARNDFAGDGGTNKSGEASAHSNDEQEATGGNRNSPSSAKLAERKKLAARRARQRARALAKQREDEEEALALEEAQKLEAERRQKEDREARLFDREQKRLEEEAKQRRLEEEKLAAAEAERLEREKMAATEEAARQAELERISLAMEPVKVLIERWGKMKSGGTLLAADTNYDMMLLDLIDMLADDRLSQCLDPFRQLAISHARIMSTLTKASRALEERKRINLGIMMNTAKSDAIDFDLNRPLAGILNECVVVDDDASVEEEQEATTAMILKAKEAIYLLRKEESAENEQKKDYDSEIRDTELGDFIQLGHESRNISTHVFHFAWVERLIMLVSFRQAIDNIRDGEKKYMKPAMTVAQLANPRETFDPDRSIHHFLRTFGRPGLKMDNVRVLAAKVICDIFYCLNQTAGADRRIFFFGIYAQVDFSSLAGGTVAGGIPYGSLDDDNHNQRRRRMFLAYRIHVLKDAIQNQLPDHIFSGKCLTRSVFRLSSTAIQDRFNIIKAKFFDINHDDDSANAQRIADALKSDGDNTSKRTLLIESQEQIDCLYRFLQILALKMQ